MPAKTEGESVDRERFEIEQQEAPFAPREWERNIRDRVAQTDDGNGTALYGPGLDSLIERIRR